MPVGRRSTGPSAAASFPTARCHRIGFHVRGSKAGTASGHDAADGLSDEAQAGWGNVDLPTLDLFHIHLARIHVPRNRCRRYHQTPIRLLATRHPIRVNQFRFPDSPEPRRYGIRSKKRFHLVG